MLSACVQRRVSGPVPSGVLPGAGASGADALDPSRHVGSRENVQALQGDVIEWRGYIDRLEAALRCYERQVAGPGR